MATFHLCGSPAYPPLLLRVCFELADPFLPMLPNHLSNTSVTGVAVGPSPSIMPAQSVCLNVDLDGSFTGQFAAFLPLRHFTRPADGQVNDTNTSSCQNRRHKRSKSTAQSMRHVSYLVLQKPRTLNCESGKLPSIRTPSAQRVYSKRCEILCLSSLVLLILMYPTGRRARRIDRCICCGICSEVCVCLSFDFTPAGC